MAKVVGSGTLGPALHPLQVSQGRFLFAFMAISTLAVILRPRLSRPNLKVHVGLSLLGWGGVTLMFAAAVYIPLSDATAISFLNPVFAMIFAIPLLGEKVGKWRWLAAAVSMTGAVILLRPGAEAIQAGALFALGAALLSQNGDVGGAFRQRLQNSGFRCEVCIGDQIPDATFVLDAGKTSVVTHQLSATEISDVPRHLGQAAQIGLIQSSLLSGLSALG